MKNDLAADLRLLKVTPVKKARETSVIKQWN